MSLLIKALKKAEQSKDASKSEASASSSGLTLELAPLEEKPQANTPSLAEEAGLSAPEKPQNAAAAVSGMALTETAKTEQISSLKPTAADTLVQDDIAAALMEESGFSLSEEAGFSEPSTKATKSAAIKTEKPVKPAKNPTQESASEMAAISASTAASPSAGEQRQAAINLLTTSNKQNRSAGNRRSLYLGLAGLILLLGLGGGFYYYLQTLDQTQQLVMQPPQGPASQPAASVKLVTPQTAAQPVLAEVKQAPALPVTAAVTVPEESAKAGVTTAQASTSPEDNVAQAVIAKPGPVTKSGTPRKSMASRRQAMMDQDSPMKVSRLNKGKPAIDATQAEAYLAFQAGDNAAAEQLYQQLLRSDPRNIDALLGLAAVAARQDHANDAVNHYQRVLELDPNNNVAQEGMILLLAQSNPTESVSRLKTMITQQPDSAHLYAALGGIYADQNQWPDAQQAYFQAFSLDANNADYAFNLAVSLDQMRKPDLALNYYQQALALLGKQGGAFDKATLENRINQLRSATGK